jgi:hypothetical protein
VDLVKPVVLGGDPLGQGNWCVSGRHFVQACPLERRVQVHNTWVRFQQPTGGMRFFDFQR